MEPIYLNLLSGIIGAILGSLVSIAIFLIQLNKDKKLRESIINQEEFNSLIYFISTYNVILKFLSVQIPKFKEHSEEILKSPLNYAFFIEVISQDADRVINKMNHEKLFLAFVNQISLNKNISKNQLVQDFQKIISRIDLVDRIVSDAKSAQERYIYEIVRRQKTYKELAEEKILNYISLLSNKIRNSEDEFYIVLNEVILNYYSHLTKGAEKSFKHLQDELVEKLKIKLVKDFKQNSEAIKIADLCRQATWIYNESIEFSKHVSQQFSDYHKGLQDSHKTLEELEEKLFKGYLHLSK